MTSYLLAFRGGGMPEIDEDRAAVMAAWNRWYEDLGPAILDQGRPIGRSSTIHADGSVRDGNDVPALKGYSVIVADDMDAALALASACPILDAGGAIDVCETLPM